MFKPPAGRALGHTGGMNLVAELARFSPDPALLPSVMAWREQARHDARKLECRSAELAHRTQALKNAELKIQALVLELAQHRRLRFGRQSEALSAEQRSLFEETGATDLGALEAELEQLTPVTPRPRQAPTGRQALPAHLPRIEHRHEPESCACGQCGTALVLIGEDVSEQLDAEPARFFVHRHIRPQYACRACETVSAAPIPAAVIDGSLAAPGLLAWVVIQKYLDHLPLYRIEQISERHGAGIARSTLADWVGRIGVALQPLADRLAEHLRSRPVLHADETPVAQLDPGAGKTLRAYLWAYRSNDLGEAEASPSRIIVFDYQTSRAGKHARDFLDGWQGHLMVDDYSGYKALFEGGHGKIVELGCLAHARRKFFELFAANRSEIAAEALRRIAVLYAIEQAGRDLCADERRALRQQQSKPALDALRDWLIRTRTTVADGGGSAKAIDYSLKRWPALSRYVDDGRFPIDNNPVENTIRPIAIGRKNWLFAGSERAGQRAAAIQSLLGTARLNGIEPYAWLKDTLEKLPLWPNSRIDELLPLRIKIID